MYIDKRIQKLPPKLSKIDLISVFAEENEEDDFFTSQDYEEMRASSAEISRGEYSTFEDIEKMRG